MNTGEAIKKGCSPGMRVQEDNGKVKRNKKCKKKQLSKKI